MFMKPDMIYGLVEDESEQGLGKLLLNNYPHREQKLEAQLNVKSKKQQTTYSKSSWHKFIERELEKLYQYDYDITFLRCPKVCNRSQAKKYQKIATVCYQCECGQKWENRYQKVVFSYQFISQESYIEESLRKMRQTRRLTRKSFDFGQNLAKELKSLIDLTIYPLLLKYELTIEDKKCAKCKKIAVTQVYKSKITVLSKLFCRQVCEVLSKQSYNPDKGAKKQ